MRLWSFHPKYFGLPDYVESKRQADYQGICGQWKEAKLAATAITKQRGYSQHSALRRFLATGNALACVAEYMRVIHAVATEFYGYNFNATLIPDANYPGQIPVTRGQLAYEWRFYLSKLAVRAPILHEKLLAVSDVALHPLFVLVDGDVEDWERVKKI